MPLSGCMHVGYARWNWPWPLLIPVYYFERGIWPCSVFEVLLCYGQVGMFWCLISAVITGASFWCLWSFWSVDGLWALDANDGVKFTYCCFVLILLVTLCCLCLCIVGAALYFAGMHWGSPGSRNNLAIYEYTCILCRRVAYWEQALLVHPPTPLKEKWTCVSQRFSFTLITHSCRRCCILNLPLQ